MMPTNQKKDDEPSKTHDFVFVRVEVAFHLVIVAIHLFLITWLLVDYADRNPQEHLADSYVSSYLYKKRDAHDTQWETYRTNLPVLMLAILIWKVVSPALESKPNDKSWLLGGLILLYSLRSDIIIYLLTLLSWYYFTLKCFSWKSFVPVCWFVTILMLYLNQKSNHFQGLSLYVSDLIGLNFYKIGNRQISFSQFLNMTFLKLLSFSLDKKRGLEHRELQKHGQKCKECSVKEYCMKGRSYIDSDDFSLKSFFNYVLFAPTLLTGPPISYKNFLSFSKYPTNKSPEILKLLLNIFLFQIFQHYAPVIQLNYTQSFVEAEVIILFHLVFIWFKFLIIWRVAKVWSQLCGVEVIDNLSRCVCNNYGFEGFWRMWHRGFNQWLVRYLYIPLGGNQSILSIVCTIMFVAFWHDHTFKILLWALGIILFILPEILIKRYARTHLQHLFKYHSFKYLSAITSAIYIYFLVLCNIIGFGYGQFKASMLLSKISNQWPQVLWSISVLTSAVLLMFYQRSKESDDKNY